MPLRQLARLVPAVALLMPVGNCAEASAEPRSVRTVVAVHWSSEEYPSNPVVDSAIRQVLLARDEAPVDYFAEYLESDRFPDEEATLAFRDYLQRKYHGRRIDVVVAITDPALQFVLHYRDQLFPGVPIVASASSTLGPQLSASGVTGAAWRAADAETIALALSLHPSTERVFVVAQELAGGYLEGAQATLAKSVGHVELKFITERSVAGLIAAVRAIPPHSLIHFIRFSRQDPGNVMFPQDVIRMVAEASPVPVYVSTDSLVGTGAVGGVVRLAPGIGTRVGEIALRVLDGTRAQDIPIVHVPALPVFDWHQLRRWRIAETALPANSVVLFREISVWERYRGTIVTVAIVLLLQSGLIAGLIVERKRRRRAEVEARRNLTAMAHLDRRAAMGELATSLAHELSQPLNAILQNAGVAHMLLNAHPTPPALGEMSDIISDIRKDDIRASEIIRRMRGLLQKHELESRPVDLNEIAQETIAIVQPDARSRGIELDMDLAAGVHQIPGDRVHLQQVLLNLLMNAMDAVAAMPPDRRRVRVSISEHDGEVRLGVSDTGAGIPADRVSTIFEPFYTTKTTGSGMGMGLTIARGIVDAHGGRMAAENNAGGGATVWFTVPMAAETVATNAGAVPIPTTPARSN
jgi:signal transduction histidine kinase